jgi:hypothetical protein
MINGYFWNTGAVGQLVSAVSLMHTKKLFIVTNNQSDTSLCRSRDEAHLRRAERDNGKKIIVEYVSESDIEDGSVMNLLHDGIRPG